MTTNEETHDIPSLLERIKDLEGEVDEPSRDLKSKLEVVCSLESEVERLECEIDKLQFQDHTFGVSRIALQHLLDNPTETITINNEADGLSGIILAIQESPLEYLLGEQLKEGKQ